MAYIYVNEKNVLDAMSVVPISDLSAADIVGEMNIVGDGRLIIPILKRLFARGVITRHKYEGQYYWRLSDEMERKAVTKFNQCPNPFGIPADALIQRYK